MPKKIKQAESPILIPIKLIGLLAISSTALLVIKGALFAFTNSTLLIIESVSSVTFSLYKEFSDLHLVGEENHGE